MSTLSMACIAASMCQAKVSNLVEIYKVLTRVCSAQQSW